MADITPGEPREALIARIQELRNRVAAAEERADRERRQHRRELRDARQQRARQLERREQQLAQREEIIEREREEQRRITARMEAREAELNARYTELYVRFDETNRNLVETNRQLKRTNNLLTWKSMTSTKNPERLKLTHQFLVTAGRKIIADGELLHVPKEERLPITKHELPQLNRGEFVRINVHSRQTRTIEDARKLRESQEGWEVQRGYMANGIDFRQNFKAEGKRRYGKEEPLFCRSLRYDWTPASPVAWDHLWTLFDTVRITTVRKPDDMDEGDYERAKDGLQDLQGELVLEEVDDELDGAP